MSVDQSIEGKTILPAVGQRIDYMLDSSRGRHVYMIRCEGISNIGLHRKKQADIQER